MSPEPGQAKSRASGFFDSVRSLLSTLVSILQTRLELACTELEEERERLKTMIALGAIALFCAALGVVLLNLLVVALFWENYRVQVLAGLVLFYFILAFLIGCIVRHKARSRPKLLSATLAELAQDSERLKSTP